MKKDPLTLEEISRNIELIATDQTNKLFKDQTYIIKTQQAQKLLKEYSIPTVKNYSFTIGEINAYMG